MIVRVAVTGCGGFIGSHVVEALTDEGNDVLGFDSFSDVLYPSSPKRIRVNNLLNRPNFRFVSCDLSQGVDAELLRGVDCVINEAGLPGQLLSWARFEDYLACNVAAVRVLLEASVQAGVPKFVQASTSSVYGKNAIGAEDSEKRPTSPYGVSKLAAENLLNAYADNFGLDCRVVRYFSVYGPRQRPDMAIRRFIDRIVQGESVEIFGTGQQRRDCTYVGDAVQGTLRAMQLGSPNGTYNISGGTDISLLEIVSLIGQILQKDVKIEWRPRTLGDQDTTRADITRAELDFGYKPNVDLRAGLERQVEWQLGNDCLIESRISNG